MGIFPRPLQKPQDFYKSPPCAMDVEATWWWMRDANDVERKNPFEGYMVITLERWSSEAKTVVACEEVGPCKEVTDQERIDETGWSSIAMNWTLSDTIVKECKDGDVFRFEYKVGTQGCKITFNHFQFN